MICNNLPSLVPKKQACCIFSSGLLNPVRLQLYGVAKLSLEGGLDNYLLEPFSSTLCILAGFNFGGALSYYLYCSGIKRLKHILF